MHACAHHGALSPQVLHIGNLTFEAMKLAQHACAHHGALSPQVLHIGNLTFEAMKLAQQDDGSAVSSAACGLHADCMLIASLSRMTAAP